jgi:hypothetical protein
MKAINRLMLAIQTIGGGNSVTIPELLTRGDIKKSEIFNGVIRGKILSKLKGVVTYTVEHRILHIGLTRDITDADLNLFIRVKKEKKIGKRAAKAAAKAQTEQSEGTVKKTETVIDDPQKTDGFFEDLTPAKN